MCSLYLMTYFRHRAQHICISLWEEREREKKRVGCILPSVMKSRVQPVHIYIRRAWNSCLLLEIAWGERWDDDGRKRASLLRSLTREFNTGERTWKRMKRKKGKLTSSRSVYLFFSLFLSQLTYIGTRDDGKYRTTIQIASDSRYGAANKSSVLYVGLNSRRFFRLSGLSQSVRTKRKFRRKRGIAHR